MNHTKAPHRCSNLTCALYHGVVHVDKCIKCGFDTEPVPQPTTTLTPAARCAPNFAFAQCGGCKSVFQVKAKGKLPKCDNADCGGKLNRIRRIQ